jgi:hypothetical protein
VDGAPASGRGTRLIRFVPRRVPKLGHCVWHSADAYYCQRLGPVFLAEWERLASAQDDSFEDLGDARVVGGRGVGPGRLEAADA